jgi:hypothetical protein
MSENTEVSPVEQQAIELGWQPKEQFESDPKNEGKRWRSADDFMDRKPLFDKIDSQGKELKQLKQAVSSLADNYKKADELAYKRAIADLKAQKVQALEEGNHAAVVEIDDKISELKTQPQPTQAQITQEFLDWVDKNEWYKTDKEMRSIADGIGLSLAKEMTPAEVFVELPKRMQKIFPEKFGKSRVPPAPEGGSARKPNGKDAEALLSPMESRIMTTIVNTGAITKDEYLKQFAASNPERFKGVKL